MAKGFNAAAEVAYGKLYEEPAAREYAQMKWPGAEVKPAGRFADIDFLVFAGPEGIPNERGGLKHQPGEFIAFLEVKKRRKVSTSWTSTIVHVNKHHAARWGKKFFKVPTVCLVMFPDTVGVFDLHEEPDGEENIERWDRAGVSVPHAVYNYTRMTWHPELLATILATVARENEVEVEENAEEAE